MSEIENIRQRDSEAIPRFLGPDEDPLLRAEMDRRWLLAEVDSLMVHGADLIARRREHDVERTRAEAQVEDLQRQLAEAVGQTEAVKQATREIMAERNNWARQLADMRDERDTAREETEKAREMYSLVSNDRDNLHVEIERLIERWEEAPPNLPTRDLRRVITRWETT